MQKLLYMYNTKIVLVFKKKIEEHKEVKRGKRRKKGG